MPYIGNPAVVGDSANTFKLLDDIVSFTVTFDATDSDVVSISGDTLTFNNHRFVTGQKVTYNDGGGTAIGGLADGSYFIIKQDQNTIKLASSASNAVAGTAIDLTSGAAGGSHTLNIAQDGVNTKFKATHSNGTKAKISRAAQITLSINGVIQQPNAGYSIESDSTIVFSSAPTATDKIFASFIGETVGSFDITDNTVDEFTANGSTTTFTLSKSATSNNDLLVTLDGVTQYPNTQSTTRAYSVLENVLTFTSAPAAGVIIQARHIGFAGASSSAVTGFYGRTGNVTLKNTDNVDVNNLTAAGTVTVTGDLNVTGDLTYDETVSRNLNVTGIATVASGIVSTGDFKIGTATTLSQDNIFTTGIVTAASFSGSGANLTNLPAANLTGTLPAISGASLTNLNASNLASGTVPTARLGSGTASSSTFLAGDSTFKTVTGTTINNNANDRVITGSDTANTLEGESTLTFNNGQLDVTQTTSSSDAKLVIRNSNTPGSGSLRLEFHYGTGSSEGTDRFRFGYVEGFRAGGSNDGGLKFGTKPDNASAPTHRLTIDSSGHVVPASNDTYDLGSSSLRWRNVYTADLHCSNKGSSNDVDGTWGDYTIQEGESDLFLINNRSGKKYKFNLTEVS